MDDKILSTCSLFIFVRVDQLANRVEAMGKPNTGHQNTGHFLVAGIKEGGCNFVKFQATKAFNVFAELPQNAAMQKCG